jgi:hypothetical protein
LLQKGAEEEEVEVDEEESGAAAASRVSSTLPGMASSSSCLWISWCVHAKTLQKQKPSCTTTTTKFSHKNRP